MSDPEYSVAGRIGSDDETVRDLVRQLEVEKPIAEVVCERVRERLDEADRLMRRLDASWSPPPFDPLLVAQALGIRCVSVDSRSLDKAMILMQGGTPTIFYRQQRSQARTRHNVFHEIAHTLFSDYDFNPVYRRVARPRILEPDGQLEYLCDLAASEFMMPMDLFAADLVENGFSASRVATLCERFGVWPEAACLRMVESDLETCALVALEPRRRSRRQAGRQAPNNGAGPQRHPFTVRYAAPSDSFRASRLTIPRDLELDGRSCVWATARHRKPAVGNEWIDLGEGSGRAFHIETLAVASTRRRRGNAVLAFFFLQ